MRKLETSLFDFSKQQATQKEEKKSSLGSFRDYLKATLPPGWDASPKHIKLICDYLDKVENGEIDRLAIHMPPRHGKTETITVRYSAYCIEKRPKDNVLVTGYNERISRRFSRKARTIVKSRRELSKDNSAQDEWSMLEGGTFMSRGVSSPPTGVGFRTLIIDDAIKSRSEAESEHYRDRAWFWYQDDIYTRLEPGGSIIMVCTRWHEDDLAARVVASEPNRWVVLNLPAICDEEDDVLGRQIGEPLWAERYNEEDLKRIKDILTTSEGEYSWNALYQQRPSSKEGSFFKPANIIINNEQFLPQIIKKVRAWDLAASERKGDYTVGFLLGLDKENNVYVMDCVRGQYDSHNRDKTIVQTAQLDGKEVPIIIPQDPGQAGLSQKKYFMRLLAGFAVLSKPVSGSKEVRAAPFSSAVNGNMVSFLKSAWNKTVIEELRVFPSGKNDDCVDALSDGFNFLFTRKSTGWGAV
jgi:predicted phage terminase large subunit-like protein